MWSRDDLKQGVAYVGNDENKVFLLNSIYRFVLFWMFPWNLNYDLGIYATLYQEE